MRLGESIHTRNSVLENMNDRALYDCACLCPGIGKLLFNYGLPKSMRTDARSTVLGPASVFFFSFSLSLAFFFSIFFPFNDETKCERDEEN